LFRWKNDEIQLKLADLKKKRDLIEYKILENETLLKSSKSVYDNLMHFKRQYGATKLLEVLGVPTINKPSIPPINESLLYKIPSPNKSPSRFSRSSMTTPTPARKSIK
jgi:hypothetical protein